MTTLAIAQLVGRLLTSILTIFSAGFFWKRMRPYGAVMAVALWMITTIVVTADAITVYAAYRPYTPRAFVATLVLSGLAVFLLAYAVHRRFKERP